MKADLLMPKGDLSVPVDNNSSRNLLTPSLSVPSIAKPLGEVRVKLKYTVWREGDRERERERERERGRGREGIEEEDESEMQENIF